MPSPLSSTLAVFLSCIEPALNPAAYAPPKARPATAAQSSAKRPARSFARLRMLVQPLAMQ